MSESEKSASNDESETDGKSAVQRDGDATVGGEESADEGSPDSASSPTQDGGVAKESVPPQKQTTRIQLLFRMLLVIAGIVVIFGAIGLCLPRDYRIRTEIEIDVPPDKVYGLIARVDEWRNWAPAWDFADNENITYFYDEQYTAITWRHNLKNTIGKLWIGYQKENETVEYYVRHGNFKDMTMFSAIDLELTESGGTRVIWWTNADLPRKPLMKGVFYGWGGLMFNAGLRGQYDRDLARLKELCETNAEITDDDEVEQPDDTAPTF